MTFTKKAFKRLYVVAYDYTTFHFEKGEYDKRILGKRMIALLINQPQSAVLLGFERTIDEALEIASMDAIYPGLSDRVFFLDEIDQIGGADEIVPFTWASPVPHALAKKFAISGVPNIRTIRKLDCKLEYQIHFANKLGVGPSGVAVRSFSEVFSAIRFLIKNRSVIVKHSGGVSAESVFPANGIFRLLFSLIRTRFSCVAQEAIKGDKLREITVNTSIIDGRIGELVFSEQIMTKGCHLGNVKINPASLDPAVNEDIISKTQQIVQKIVSDYGVKNIGNIGIDFILVTDPEQKQRLGSATAIEINMRETHMSIMERIRKNVGCSQMWSKYFVIPRITVDSICSRIGDFFLNLDRQQGVLFLNFEPGIGLFCLVVLSNSPEDQEKIISAMVDQFLDSIV